jgi:hypothetical protein
MTVARVKEVILHGLKRNHTWGREKRTKALRSIYERSHHLLAIPLMVPREQVLPKEDERLLAGSISLTPFFFLVHTVLNGMVMAFYGLALPKSL